VVGGVSDQFCGTANCNTTEEEKQRVLSGVMSDTNFLLSPHAFARLPLGSRFLLLRGNGKECYAG